MPAKAILTAARDVFKAALAAPHPECLVVLGIPRRLNQARVLYLYGDGYSEVADAFQKVRRTHVIPLHLMLLATASDDGQLETDLADLSDVIANALYAHTHLNGTCADSELLQRDGSAQGGAQFLLQDQAEYRHRWWTLHAMEDLDVSFLP